MPVDQPKELPGGLTIVNKEPEERLGIDKFETKRKITLILKKAVYKKQIPEKKKIPHRKAKFKNWIMPPPPEQFIKSKNNDPL